MTEYTFDQYALDACRTMVHPTRTTDEQIPVFALGVAGESGECAEIVKKFMAHGMSYTLARAKLREELGDVLWYLTALALAFRIRLEDVALENTEKLRMRYPDGFKKKWAEDQEPQASDPEG